MSWTKDHYHDEIIANSAEEVEAAEHEEWLRQEMLDAQPKRTAMDTTNLKVGSRFTINTEAHANGKRVYVVRTIDETGITAYDTKELPYPERNRTLYCINATPLNYFIKSGELTIQTCSQCGYILRDDGTCPICPTLHQQAEREQIEHTANVIDKAKETAQEALSGAVVGIVLSVLLLLSLLTNQ